MHWKSSLGKFSLFVDICSKIKDFNLSGKCVIEVIYLLFNEFALYLILAVHEIGTGLAWG